MASNKPKKQADARSQYAKATEIVQKYTQKAQRRARKRAKSNNFKLRNLRYYLSETFRSLVRNKLMTLTSIATVAACLLIVVFSFAIAQNINHILAHVETTVGIEVFLEDELDEAQVDILEQNIYALPHVTSVTFVHPEDALQRLAESLEDETGLLTTLFYESPLRRGFTIELDDIRNQRAVVDALREMYGIFSIRAAVDLADGLATVNNYIGIFSAIIILILGILAVVIITNTIKLTVNSRRNEILIMRYVGATDWFIKWPFVIEGVMIGILGAGIALGIGWLGYDGMVSAVREFPLIQQIQLPFRSTTEIFPVFTPIAIILGGIIGILGSMSSMRKYLSV